MNNRNKTLIAILILLLIIVGAGLGYTLVEMKKLKSSYSTLEDKNNTVEELYAELESEYDRSLQQLEELEGENAAMDSLLNIKKEELREAKAYIASLISKGSANAKDLADARNLIKQLTNQRITLQNTVDSLNTLNLTLQEENLAIVEENQIIRTNLETVATTASNLQVENTGLKEEKSRASILTASNMTAQGIKIKGNGKEVDVNKASGTRKLKICFDLLENKIAPEGPTRLYVRIIGPDGVTLALQSMGSGTFTHAETGQAMQYTYEIAPDFNRSGKSVCSYWDQNIGYAEGNYQVEVFQKGYPIGQTTFELR